LRDSQGVHVTPRPQRCRATGSWLRAPSVR
jgi:hypothetical protein